MQPRAIDLLYSVENTFGAILQCRNFWDTNNSFHENTIPIFPIVAENFFLHTFRE